MKKLIYIIPVLLLFYSCSSTNSSEKPDLIDVLTENTFFLEFFEDGQYEYGEYDFDERTSKIYQKFSLECGGEPYQEETDDFEVISNSIMSIGGVEIDVVEYDNTMFKVRFEEDGETQEYTFRNSCDDL